MNIYFAGSIRGGRQDSSLYGQIIEELKKVGNVLTEHLGDPEIGDHGEPLPPEEVYQRDVEWLSSADIVIAECTVTSLGVGYELAYAEARQIPIIALFRPNNDEGRTLSSMIKGNSYNTVIEYNVVDELIPRLLKVLEFKQ
jgi:nucleoside 2-deoxyribosyltransferase